MCPAYHPVPWETTRPQLKISWNAQNFSQVHPLPLPTGSSPPATLTQLTCSLACDGVTATPFPVSPEEPEHFLTALWLQVTRGRSKNSGQECRNAIKTEDDRTHSRVSLHCSLSSASELCYLGQLAWPLPTLVLSFVRGGHWVRLT